MVIAYWVVAALLVIVYVYSGGLKVIRSQARLQPMMKWVGQMPMPAVRVIGVLELLGAIGLVVPPLTSIAPWLALAAAIGLVLVQLGAIALHLARGEARQLGFNAALLVLAAVEVWLATVWL